ncbi:NADH dehydrogenase [ubiquinone] 1 alpha subcomplex assembly factor 2 isoform X2 [Rana temporaria]|uniref:NADH dehydrogenase [ubiquinone] 1 alpha subcomplex assembly factor 2 isoform X2 n=1 Tax=Rana temporaria TaxID=8407 RepID=UPI001AADA15C|nr:NADH dehydrogenase [ubiquinone] 1 alpha subcomplex assembly factor 2 isoform X2 [Rana temporaria]
MDRLRTLLQRTLGRVRQHMGTDQYGNKYYYIPQQKSWTGRAVRERRIVEPVQKDTYKYEFGNMPIEWEAWIRGKRKDPPTTQEILRNEQARREVGAKAQALIQQEKHLQSIEDKGPLNSPMKTQIKGHASAPVYSKHTASEEPSSTASTFEPGSWNPQKK